jgi:hypothetical protein
LLKCPYLEPLAHQLANSLANGGHKGLIFCDYPTLIQRYGGIEKLVEDSMRCVNKDIKELLENQDVTVDR